MFGLPYVHVFSTDEREMGEDERPSKEQVEGQAEEQQQQQEERDQEEEKEESEQSHRTSSCETEPPS